MRYACTACGSPAVVLPSRLDQDAFVHCRDCSQPVATWGDFKHRTTQAILADTRTLGEAVNALSYDPLDLRLVRALARRP